MTTSAKERLANYIRTVGPIKTVRVSSAQARGLAKRYAYWGAVRYQVQLSRDGTPKHVALGRANSDRRSYRLAERDALAIADSEGRIYVELDPGQLDELECESVLKKLYRTE